MLSIFVAALFPAHGDGASAAARAGANPGDANPTEVGPTIVRAAEAEGRFLTPAIEVSDPTDGRLLSMRLPDRSISLAPGSRVGFHGGTVVSLLAQPDRIEARLFEASGRLIRQLSVPRDRSLLAFGRAVAAYPPSVHEPGSRYDFQLTTDLGRRLLRREDRTVTHLITLERHLAISSYADTPTRDFLTEIVDETGQVIWEFPSAEAGSIAVAVSGQRAAAVIAATTGSRLWFYRQGGMLERVDLSDTAGNSASASGRPTLTDVAFIAGTDRLLVWGKRNIGVVDLESQQLVWRSELPAGHEQLAGDTSMVAMLDGQVATFSRMATGEHSFDVQVVWFDVRNGQRIGTEILFSTSERLTSTRRFQDPTGEQVILQPFVYRLSPAGGSR